MADYITIDGGTTNTRISLVRNHRVADTLKFSVGARKGISDPTLLKETIRKGIAELLHQNQLQEESIACILASGMITSEFGLLQLEHIPVPAGLGALHDTMHHSLLEEISRIPFAFIRGVKMNAFTLDGADMMRGEETELMGLFCGEGLYILPGSHSKLIETNGRGEIVSFKTMLTGEMINALSSHTILKDAVALQTEQIHKEFLLKGYECCAEKGINEALFKVRVLKNLLEKDEAEVYSFYMGVILCNEIRAILARPRKRIVIGGKRQLKEPLAILLEALSKDEIIPLPEEKTEEAPALGMVKIYEHSI